MPTEPRQKLQISETSLDPSRLPAHIAIILDGNGRWAQKQDKARHIGHYHGYLALKRAVYACDDLGVQYLTVYGFSSENWRRPQEEVHGLMDLMADAMQTEMDELMENNIRVRIAGRMEGLPELTNSIFTDAMKRTFNNTALTFTLAINYGGRSEIVDAVKKIVRDNIPADDINEDSVGDRLYWPDVPDPDLLIRTAGELRLSNFLLWETAYSEIHVTQTLWPDFNNVHLIEAIADYQRRVRKFGAVVE